MNRTDRLIADVPITTPTVERLRRGGRHAEYRYSIGQSELVRLTTARVCPSAILAYMAISAASRAAGGGWVTLRPPIRDGWGFSVEWWRINTTRLANARMIDVVRKPSQLPKYRLRPALESVPDRPEDGSDAARRSSCLMISISRGNR